MTDRTQQHAARHKRAISAFCKWLTNPIDNPGLALGLALLGGVGLLLLLKYLTPFLQQFLLPTP